LIIVSVACMVLGMGSLKVLHVPTWMSPFDLLRPLPGFRSIGVTGRFWGFLALPLSLLSAAALWKYASECPVGWRTHVCLGGVLALQIGFQADTLGVFWLNSPRYQSIAPNNYFRQGGETIDYVAVKDDHLQGELITPIRGISDCYDMDDFRRPDNVPGNQLVQHVTQESLGAGRPRTFVGTFSTWSHIRLRIDTPNAVDSMSNSSSGSERTQVSLRQAYHTSWRARGCDTYADARGNLAVDCPASSLRGGSVELQFNDPVSELAARVSIRAWRYWLPASAALVLSLLVSSLRTSYGLWPSLRRTDRTRTAIPDATPP
jgi:hypothetical protein